MQSNHIFGSRGKLHALIWTKTPWIIPAIAVRTSLVYSIIQTDSHDCLLITEDRVAEVWHNRGDFTVLGWLKGSALIGTEYINPFDQATRKARPFIHANYVSGISGTGLVYCAPGHDMEAYNVCLDQDIAAFAPIDNAGRFIKAAFVDQPEILEGKGVLDDDSTLDITWLTCINTRIATHTIGGPTSQ